MHSAEQQLVLMTSLGQEEQFGDKVTHIVPLTNNLNLRPSPEILRISWEFALYISIAFLRITWGPKFLLPKGCVPQRHAPV